MKNIIPLFFILAAMSCQRNITPDPVQNVDPFIGTDAHGHTFPGACLPFGMVQLSPDTRKDSWDGCSGYHYSDSTILGFSHTHLSGTGVGDYGDIRIMPLTGTLYLLPGENNSSVRGYASKFTHARESASPGYYQVFLKDYNINVELTATRRCGFHQYTLSDDVPIHIVIDLFESVTSETILESGIEITSNHEISGFRRTKGWAEDQHVYFYADFSQPFTKSGVAESGIALASRREGKGKNIQGFVTFNKVEGNKVKVKVGISAVSREGAKKNLEAEIPGWDFEIIRKEACKAWNKELSKVEVIKGQDIDKTKFYTALYHSFIAPNLFSDSDGSYRGHDSRIHNDRNHEIYTVFSLWDTYRALHPMLTILQPDKTTQFIHTLVDIYEKGGLLPVWELAGNETFCMIGYHSVPVLVDAIMKGYEGIDLSIAYEAMKTSARSDHFGLKPYREYGYIPADEESESVSKTLEYAYDDWCIAMMARKMGNEEEYREFIQRAQYYKNLYDPETGFLRGKLNSTFTTPFDPTEVNFMLTEANTWQYTFYVPQDIDGLMELMGGADVFSGKLDEMFSTSSQLSGREQADITGLIGQYAHGNEPSHHMVYLYNYAGHPYKTQKLVRKIMDELYGTGADGLCGNEDCGQMSAWFVMSAMGFYPVTPGINQYIIGSPLFEDIMIHLPGKKKFSIKALNNSKVNIYIQSAMLNGEDLRRSFLYHNELMEGGELVLTMGPEPSKIWATGEDELPISTIEDFLMVPIPFFISDHKTFRDEIEVGIGNVIPDVQIYYEFNGNKPGQNSTPYQKALLSSSTFEITAIASRDDMITSLPASAMFRKIDHRRSIRLKNPYSPQYTGGGDLALIDGEKGGVNFRTGKWQGYHGVDFESVIDLGKKQPVEMINARFLDDQNAWIFLPVEVEISISDKPYDFKVILLVNNPIAMTTTSTVNEFKKEGIQSTVRYIKIKARNIGKCPEWHKGAGGEAWLFIDEIEIE